MSCGVPVVGTDVGGVAEAIADAGLVVPARDPEAMSHACFDLFTSPEKRSVMGTRARSRVQHHFSLAQMLAAHDELYISLRDGGAQSIVDLRPRELEAADSVWVPA
jgi:glycosyltransferase involved in cell wall biosynthesis